jgi:SAM-dependent methyltransferase
MPILLRDFAAVAPSLMRADVSPEVLGVLAAQGTDDDRLQHEAALASSYLDSSWGDRADPKPDGPGGLAGFGAIAEKVAARAQEHVGRALDLGCGVGRALAHLARGADLAVGVDSSPWALRPARRILAGEPLRYARRATGRHYTPATVDAGSLAAPGAQLICADALAPPLAPGTFDRVAALNLLDTVPSPARLLDVLAAMLAPGGELLVCAPYAWKSGATEEAARLGSDPAAELRAALEQRGLRIEDEDLRVPWTLRRDGRAASVYDAHWLRARKP